MGEASKLRLGLSRGESDGRFVALKKRFGLLWTDKEIYPSCTATRRAPGFISSADTGRVLFCFTTTEPRLVIKERTTDELLPKKDSFGFLSFLQKKVVFTGSK